MNKKLAGVVVAVLAIAAAVWFFALRDKGGSKPATKPTPAPTDPWQNAAGSGSGAAPASAPVIGMSQRWTRDFDKPGKLQLEGQVIDEAGDPVGGAVVTLSSVPPRTATTEADGGFSFDKLIGREYALSAVAGKKVGGPVVHRLSSSSDPVILRLATGATLVVSVVDANDKPVAKASVTVESQTESSGTTGDDGTATFEPVHPGWVSVHARAPGYATANGFTQLGGANTNGQLRLVLRTGYAVSGRVIDEKGTPIANVSVGTAGLWDIPGGGHRAQTDAKGNFKIEALAAGTHTLIANDGEHAPGRSGPVVVADKPVDGIEIVMQAGGLLAGRVLDHAKVPVVYATVRVAGDGSEAWLVESRQASTDDNGNFEIKGLPRTKLKVRADNDVAASEIAVVDLTAEAEKRGLELVLTITGTIAGSVVDETGQPVAEVQVNAFPDIFGGSSADALTLAGMSSATTDGAGRFTIRGLPAGEYRVQAARASGRGRYEWGQAGVKAKTGDTNVKLTLAAPGSITGKVVLENGKAPTLANLSLSNKPPSAAKPDGTFVLEDVEPGTYDLVVRGPEFAELVKNTVVVKPGAPTDVGTLTLIRGRKVSGRVVDGAGNPIGGARIKSGDMLYSMQGQEDQMANFEEMYGMKSATSDQEGRFVLVGIDKKATSVLADHATKGRSNAIEIPAGTDDPPAITLTLKGFGQIVGKVTMKGKPLSGVAVTASPKGGGAQLQVAQTEQDGSYALNKIGEGVVVVSAMQQENLGMSMKTASAEVTVTAGKQAKLDIDIPVGSVTLSISVKPLPNHKVDSAQIFLMRGVVALKNAKELTDVFLGGAAVGMKFWLGEGKPPADFPELVPGDYSVCSIPITGDLSDPQFQAKLQQNMELLAVHCKQAKVTPAPTTQSFVHELPSMPEMPK